MEILITPDHTVLTDDAGKDTTVNPEQLRVVVIAEDGKEFWIDIDELVDYYRPSLGNTNLFKTT